ncbi:hypothetical protein QJS83_07845 [Bdellovibrio sp. 22V]|uniref:hypothetical protein n=1 Tax=Bdellovibrio TaxID=958 RepID=UPI0025430F36|nr:hypothetical protein [Bdellovibrio sp. 22V]WII73787.1 hypothetical protein QJS83_07845 [Bdellovibrio sp. 22V]
MKKWLLVLSVLAFSSASYAQKIKVRKVKGNQAIVDFAGGTLVPGQVYELAGDVFETSPGSMSRKYVVALSFSLENTKSDASGAENETDITLTGRFGWNFGNIEVGPLGSYSSNANGPITTNIYKVGAFGDYNLIANTPGESFLYGVGGTASFGQIDTGTGSKPNLMDFFVGPFAKWFPSGSNVGFRADLGFIYQKQSGGIGGDVTVSGLSTSAGLIAYF